MSNEVDIIYEGTVASATEFSKVTSLGSYSGYFPQISWTNGGSGNASIEVSNDGKVWDLLPDSEVDIIGDDSYGWNVDRGFYALIRIKIQDSIGAVIKITICGKAA